MSCPSCWRRLSPPIRASRCRCAQATRRTSWSWCPVTTAEVAGQKLIMFDRTSSYYEITQAAFLSSGAMLRGLMELDSIEAAKKMVERGLGVALLPRTAVAREVEGRT